MSAPERISIPAIRWAGGVMVPLPDADRGAYVADQGGCSYYRSGDDVRRHLTEFMGEDDLADIEAEEPGYTEAHNMLADLIDELCAAAEVEP